MPVILVPAAEFHGSKYTTSIQNNYNGYSRINAVNTDCINVAQFLVPVISWLSA